MEETRRKISAIEEKLRAFRFESESAFVSLSRMRIDQDRIQSLRALKSRLAILEENSEARKKSFRSGSNP